MSDHDLPYFERLQKRLNLNKASRMHGHYVAIRPFLKARSPRQRAEATFFCERFEHYHHKTVKLISIRLFFSIIVYAGLVVGLLKMVPFLQFLIELIQIAVAVFGGIALLIVLGLSIRINLNLELMNEALTHLITIYHDNPGRDTAAMIASLKKTM